VTPYFFFGLGWADASKSPKIKSFDREEPGSWCLGEWSPPVGIGILMKDNVLPPSLVNTFVYGMCARQLGTIALALGRADDAKRYQTKSAKIAASFHGKFYDKERGTYLRGLHGASAFALVLGAVPADVKARVVDNLAEHVLGTCSGHPLVTPT
jgi:hypothetical protein